MKTGGAWSFGSSPATETQKADTALSRATGVETAARGAQSGLATAAALGATALIASGPALPVVAGLAIVVAVGSRIYAQNQKLTVLFKRTAKLVNRMQKVLTSMKAAAEKRVFDLDDTDVRDDANELQRTIGELIGPDAFKEIQASGIEGQDRNTLTSRFQRFIRRVAPESTIRKFNEQLIQLSLDFSVLQGEFAVRLEELTPVLAKEIVGQGKSTGNVTPNIAAANQGAITEPPKGGQKTRRRHRGHRRTRKI
jgi:hypothetical protein